MAIYPEPSDSDLPVVPYVSHIGQRGERATGSIPLKRDPDYWELRAYAGRDPITGRPRYVSRTFRGGKRDAGKALTQFVAEIDVKGTQTDLSVDGLLTSHIDHLEQRGRGAAFRAKLLDARVAAAVGDVPRRRASATAALGLVNAPPRFSRHPTVGLVDASPSLLAEVADMAGDSVRPTRRRFRRT